MNNASLTMTSYNINLYYWGILGVPRDSFVYPWDSMGLNVPKLWYISNIDIRTI